MLFWVVRLLLRGVDGPSLLHPTPGILLDQLLYCQVHSDSQAVPKGSRYDDGELLLNHEKRPEKVRASAGGGEQLSLTFLSSVSRESQSTIVLE